MFYLKKFVKMLFSIFLIGTLSFLLLEMIPGDPAVAILGVESSPEDIELLREALGLNKSFLERLPLTMEIALISIAIVFLVSIPLSFLLYKIKNKHIKNFGDFLVGKY